MGRGGSIFRNVIKKIVTIPKIINDNVQDVIKDTISGKNVIDSVKDNAKDIAEEITGTFKPEQYVDNTPYGGDSGAGNNQFNQTTDFFEDVDWGALDQHPQVGTESTGTFRDPHRGPHRIHDDRGPGGHVGTFGGGPRGPPPTPGFGYNTINPTMNMINGTTGSFRGPPPPPINRRWF